MKKLNEFFINKKGNFQEKKDLTISNIEKIVRGENNPVNFELVDKVATILGKTQPNLTLMNGITDIFKK